MESRKKIHVKSQGLPLITTSNNLQCDGNGNDDEFRKRQSATVLSRMIHWVESQYVPACIARRLYNSTIENVPIITGLKKVFYGTQPAAEVVKVGGIRLPRYLFYMISGSGCDVIQFMVYVLFYKQINDASLCWALSFMSSIVFRHTTHRYLVFGDYVGGYWRSLGRMYAGYSIIIVLSTIFHFVVIEYINMSHIFVWILTLLWTGIVNYLILKKLWSFDGSKDINETKGTELPTDNDSS